MEEVAAAHARARFCLVTCDLRHAYLRVGYTIRVVQGLGLLGGSTLCAFDARFPVGASSETSSPEIAISRPSSCCRLGLGWGS